MKSTDFNPYISLRCEGVVGSVPNDFESITIYAKGDESVTIFVGFLAPPSCWDYGFRLMPGEVQKLPGEGSGFFMSRKDALLFGLMEIIKRFPKDSIQRKLINDKVADILTPALF